MKMSSKKDSPILVSNPPRYSDVINCCVKAVLPHPGDPITFTRSGNRVDGGAEPGLVLTLDRELDVLDAGDKGQKSPSDETMLLVLLDRIESLLRTITPFAFISKALTVYVSISGSMFKPSIVRFMCCGFLKAFLVGMLLVLGRISSFRKLSRFFSFGFLNDDALFLDIGSRFKLLLEPNNGLGHLQVIGLLSVSSGIRRKI